MTRTDEMMPNGALPIETPPKKRKRHWVRWALLSLLAFVLTSAFLFWVTLPNPGEYRDRNPDITAIIQFREDAARAAGKPLRRLWKWVPLARISKNLVRAVIATEDDKFYQHSGFDWEAIREAWNDTLDKKRITRGGSTITQQCAKNLYLSPERSLWRKVREAAITWYMERNLSKDRILELYLNIIEWGDGVYGAEAAARFWFHKSAAALSVSESIRLASVIANPHVFSPLDDASPRLRKKRAIVAYRLAKRGWGGPQGAGGLLRALNLKSKEQEDARKEYPEEFKEQPTGPPPTVGAEAPGENGGTPGEMTPETPPGLSSTPVPAPPPGSARPDGTRLDPGLQEPGSPR